MKKILLAVSIFVSMFLFSMLSYADSPLTSTGFSEAYMDVSIVKEASNKGVIDTNIAKYLSDAGNPIDVKAAVINALSWSVDGKNNAEKYSKEIYKTSLSKLKINNLNGDQLFCIGYLLALDDYNNTGNALKYLKLSEQKINNSFTVSVIRALIQAQDSQDGLWKSIQSVCQNSKLKQDMREDAVHIILDYMACEGIQVSPNNFAVENGKSQKVYLFGALSVQGELPYQIVKQSDKAYTSLTRDKYGIYYLNVTGVANGNSSIDIKYNSEEKIKINFQVISSDTYGKLNNSFSFYAGSKNALKGKAKFTINAAPYIKGDNQFVPVEIFTKISGAKIQYDKKKETCNILYSGNTVTIKSGSNQASINGKVQKLLYAIEANNKQLYISAKDFGTIAGKECLYYNGLILFADKKGQFDTVTDDYILDEIISIINDGKSALEYPVVFEQDKKYGYKNSAGKIVIKPIYKAAYNFSEGVAVVSVDVQGAEKYGFIDSKGNYVIKPIYDWAQSFYHGLAPVIAGDKSVFIDKTGKEKTSADYSGVGAFCNGLAAVADSESGKWGYIDLNEKLVIPYTYDDCRGFSEGLAAVKVVTKWGYIDRTGKFVIQPTFDEPDDFINGIVNVKINGRYSDYNRSGKNISYFDNGDVYVGEENKGVLEGKGVYTWADGTQYIGDFKDGKRDGKGIYTATDGTIQDGQWGEGLWKDGEYKDPPSDK
jgi:hypothetical protein